MTVRDPLIDTLPMPPRRWRRQSHRPITMQRLAWAVETGLMTDGEAMTRLDCIIWLWLREAKP